MHKNNKLIIAALLAAPLLMSACANKSANGGLDRSYLRQGLSKQEVIKHYGQPQEVEKTGGKYGVEHWRYYRQKKSTGPMVGVGVAAGQVAASVLGVNTYGLLGLASSAHSASAADDPTSDRLTIDFNARSEKVVGWSAR